MNEAIKVPAETAEDYKQKVEQARSFLDSKKFWNYCKEQKIEYVESDELSDDECVDLYEKTMANLDAEVQPVVETVNIGDPSASSAEGPTDSVETPTDFNEKFKAVFNLDDDIEDSAETHEADETNLEEARSFLQSKKFYDFYTANGGDYDDVEALDDAQLLEFYNDMKAEYDEVKQPKEALLDKKYAKYLGADESIPDLDTLEGMTDEQAREKLAEYQGKYAADRITEKEAEKQPPMTAEEAVETATQEIAEEKAAAKKAEDERAARAYEEAEALKSQQEAEKANDEEDANDQTAPVAEPAPRFVASADSPFVAHIENEPSPFVATPENSQSAPVAETPAPAAEAPQAQPAVPEATPTASVTPNLPPRAAFASSGESAGSISETQRASQVYNAITELTREIDAFNKGKNLLARWKNSGEKKTLIANRKQLMQTLKTLHEQNPQDNVITGYYNGVFES